MSDPVKLATRVDESGPGHLELDAAELRVVAGPDRNRRQPLDEHCLVIGSGGDCGLVLHDPTVSARHAEIVLAGDGWVVRDLGSKNGVRLHGWPIERAPLAAGMQLRLGKTTLQVHALRGHHAIPLERPGQFAGLVAHSVKMRAVVAQLTQLGPTETTVLLEGETGCGKELAAHALHAFSVRAGEPFVVFDCGAVAPTLAAAELFGHDRGAFSGASSDRAGVFEAAHGGTLFLDEIGELPLELQPLLLRAIEQRVIRRLGGRHDRACDVRVVAATHRNLAEEVQEGRFRKDLYYRLAVARVRIPPLRERPEDLPLLARTFAAELGALLEPELIAVLSSYEWPGNVRELRNLIARQAAQPSSAAQLLREQSAATLAIADPLFAGVELRPLHEARTQAGDLFERRYLLEALARAEDNVSRAAELAGVSRQLFTRLLAKHNLRARDRAP
jgi:DNA-binding NtrC family response regulator